MKAFELTHKVFRTVRYFTEETAPDWLCKGGLAGSSMDNRWFWEGYVLTLAVGDSVDTDFSTIKRIS